MYYIILLLFCQGVIFVIILNKKSHNYLCKYFTILTSYIDLFYFLVYNRMVK